MPNASNKNTVDGIFSVMMTGFDNIGQALNELFDNSISAISKISGSGDKKIFLTVKENCNFNSIANLYSISVEDTGVGFSEADIENIFSIGNTDSSLSSLNIHGAGLKYALFSATGSIGNIADVWTIYSRDFKLKSDNKYLKISAPFEDNIHYEIIDNSTTPWPGEDNANTIISFFTTSEFFSRIGTASANRFDTFMDYIYEDIGYTYANIINGKVCIKESPIAQKIEFYMRAECKDGTFLGDGKLNSRNFMLIDASEPDIAIVGKDDHGITERYDLDSGLKVSTGGVAIKYSFIQIKMPKETTYYDRSNHMFDNLYHRRHYKPGAKTHGVEIRLNGRVLKDNLLPEIWEDKNRHPSYYRFLGMIDVICCDKNLLPETKALKVDFNSGRKYFRLLEIIAKLLPPNELKTYQTDSTPADLTEEELVNELIKWFNSKNTPMGSDHYTCVPDLDASGKRTCPEEAINLGVSDDGKPMRNDLIVTCEHNDGTKMSWMIECKRNEAKPENVAQLAQYCITTSRDIDKAILITNDVPSPSDYILEIVKKWNSILPSLGKPQIECQNWSTYGISSKKS